MKTENKPQEPTMTTPETQEPRHWFKDMGLIACEPFDHSAGIKVECQACHNQTAYYLGSAYDLENDDYEARIIKCIRCGELIKFKVKATFTVKYD